MSQDFFKKILQSFIAICLLVISPAIFAQEKSELESIQIENETRQYRLYIPANYSLDTSYPLVLNFHGTSGHPDMQEGLSEFEKLAKTENFIVVTPLALFKRNEKGPITWNVDFEQGPDDVKFIRDLLNQLGQKYNIDNKRIFSTGFSGGARMSSRLACDLSSTIAAIGPVAGVRYPQDCKPSRAVPVITFHGTKDKVNHYTLRDDSPVYWTMGVEDALSGWVSNNQCQAPIYSKYSSSLEKIEYQQCQNNAEIVFYRSTQAGHTWPASPMAKTLAKYGLGKTEEELQATKLIWQFFKDHPMQ